MEVDTKQVDKMLRQGAEAKLYRSEFYGRPCIRKERFQKMYRHPSLDRSLTTQRLKAEVRANTRCRMAGILTPTVYMANMDNGSIYMEEVTDSVTVREHIQCTQASETRDSTSETTDSTSATSSGAVEALLPLARKIGTTLATMHASNIIHGDLTTSNMLVQGEPSQLRLYLIDFGLSSSDASPEDKGVDLYVLERALLSTHPRTERLFEEILSAYSQTYGNKKACREVLDKLEDVRLRGRKRTMVG